jgi:multidrug efflux pump subunit AcrB
VRSSFFGEQAQRVQREIDDIRVMVRLPLEKRQSLHTLEQMRIRLPNGGEAPLRSVANVSFGKARAEINRTNGAQAITIWAQAENASVDIVEIGRDLEKRLKEVFVDHPELSWRFTGYLAEHEQTNERFVLAAGDSLSVVASAMLHLVGHSFWRDWCIVRALDHGRGAVLPFRFWDSGGGRDCGEQRDCDD